MRVALAGMMLLTACGPSERESMDPGVIEREAIAQGQARAAAEGARHETIVKCACDAEGGLHVQAPNDARVTATGPGAAEIALDDAPQERVPLRTTKSLGFIGDNPLTPNVSYGGPWNAPDAVLPPHAHVDPYPYWNPLWNDAPMPRAYRYRPYTRPRLR